MSTSSNYSSALPVNIENVTTTTQGAKKLLDVTVANNGIVGTPLVANVSMQNLNTEYSYLLTPGTTRVLFKTRNNGLLRFTFQAGQSGTNYISVPAGTSYTLDSIDPSVSLTIYFQSDKNNETLEVISWI